MPNSDRIDRRIAKAKKRAPTAAENRAAFEEIRRNVAKRKNAPAPQPVPVKVLAAKGAVAARKINTAQSKGRTLAETAAGIRAYQDKTAAVESKRRMAAAKAKQSFLGKVTGGHLFNLFGPDKPLTYAQLRLDTNKDGQLSSGEARSQAERQRIASVIAPGLKVLEQTTRPIHAVAGGTDAALSGKNIPQAALRGLQNKDKMLFGNVLRKRGVPGAGVLGFGLDVLLDPLAHGTGGVGTIADKAASKEAARIAAKAAKAGMPEETVRALALRAGGRAAEKAKPGTGVVLKFAGREVPGVRAGTASVVRGTGKAARKVTPGKVQTRAATVGHEAKNIVRDVRPTLTPAGMDPVQFAAVHDAAAAARAQQQQAREFGQRLGRALQKHVPKADRAAVANAIETKTIGKLPTPNLQQAARRVRSDLRYNRRLAVRSGVAIKDVTRGRNPGDARDYFPHALTESLQKGEGIIDDTVPMVEGVGRRTITVGAAKRRADRRTLAVINAETPGKFSTDVPLVLANHFAQLGDAAGRASLNQVLGKVGREVPWSKNAAGEDVITSHLGKDEALYRINGSNIKKVDGAVDKKQGGRYVVLNHRLVDKELASLGAPVEASTIGKLVNQGTQKWKQLALFSAAYHIRNAIGDATMAYYEQPGHLLPRNTVQAGKILAADRTINKQIDRLDFARPKVNRKGETVTVKVAGERREVGKVLRDVKTNAGMQTGFVGRELNDLVGRDATGAVKKVRRGKGKLSGVLQARENLMRVATTKQALDQGLTAAEAARVSRRAHIDYGDLTPLERRLRRAAVPFYTFAARNVPIQARALITKPGKIANFQKIREESASALGLKPGWEKQLTEFQQRELVIPVGRNKDGSVKFLDFGLPVVGVNELPAGIDPREYVKELSKFGTQMLGPTFKIPVELTTGIDTFQRRPIENPNSPLRPAPVWAKALGLTRPMIDSKTGKTVPGWSGTAAYIARQITPGPVGQVNQLATKGTNGRGQVSGLEKDFSVVTGIKIGNTNDLAKNTEAVYDDLKANAKKMALLRQTPGGQFKPGTNVYTKEYAALLDDNKKLGVMKDELLKQAGRPAKVRGTRGRPKSPGSKIDDAMGRIDEALGAADSGGSRIDDAMSRIDAALP